VRIVLIVRPEFVEEKPNTEFSIGRLHGIREVSDGYEGGQSRIRRVTLAALWTGSIQFDRARSFDAFSRSLIVGALIYKPRQYLARTTTDRRSPCTRSQHNLPCTQRIQHL
jgi:hypothetical protein